MAKKYYNGMTITTNTCGDFVILNYINRDNIHIKFVDTGFETTISLTTLSSKSAKDPYVRSVCGVGYLGEQSTRTSNSYRYNHKKSSREYDLWQQMVRRCYSPIEQAKTPTYKGCSVVDRWHSFANFYQDIKGLDGYQMWLNPDNKYSIDKDIKIPGNKVYGPATCIFVPQTENIIDANNRRWAKTSKQKIEEIVE